jgi:hypothetical protein
MTSDTEPRYRLVDANGNVVGSLFAESDGTLKLQEGTSGNDNELAIDTQGTLKPERLSTNLADGDQDISGNRSFGTTFTNTTGTDILLTVKVSAVDGSPLDVQLRTSGGPVGATDTIDGILYDAAPSGAIHFLTARVRDGDDYILESFDGNATINSWVERPLE